MRGDLAVEIGFTRLAAMAECVMLNKGPYVAEAVRILDEVIVRMEGHQDKKRARMRALSAWQAV